jgi:hypothetical protein
MLGHADIEGLNAIGWLEPRPIGTGLRRSKELPMFLLSLVESSPGDVRTPRTSIYWLRHLWEPRQNLKMQDVH